MNTPTSFYLPSEDMDNLCTAVAELMKQSLDYRNLLTKSTVRHNPDTIFAEPLSDIKDFKPLDEKEVQKQPVL